MIGKVTVAARKNLASEDLCKSELVSITLGQAWLEEKQLYLDLKTKERRSH